MDELVMTRVLDAPRDLVWKAWTDPGHLAKWWGPPGAGLRVAVLDLRAGGLFHYSMTPPGAPGPLWGKFVYDEVQAPERLVFRNSFSDETGGTVRNPWNPQWPLEVKNTLTLEEEGGKTVLTLRGRPQGPTPEEEKSFQANKHNVTQGFQGSFAQLEAHLAGVQEADRALVYRRTFEAPRDRVWSGWTDPVAFAVWWGPAGFGNTVHSLDVRPGGAGEFIMHGPDGTNYPNRVVYRTVEVPGLLAYDHGSPGQPDEFRVTVTFTGTGDRTDMVYKMLFPTVAAKQAAVERYGASEGLRQTMDRFARWLEKGGLVLTRVLEVPRSLVWKGFTDPALGAQVDLRVGGHYRLGSPGGTEVWLEGTLQEIILNQKLVYSEVGAPGHPVTLCFTELGKGRTLVAVHQPRLSPELHGAASAVWIRTLDSLANRVSLL